MRRLVQIVLAGALIGSIAACDTVQPLQIGTLVVESFLKAGEPLPVVRVGRTFGVSEGLESNQGFEDAEVELILDGVRIQYEPVPTSPGLFQPESRARQLIVPPLASFELYVRTPEDEANASGSVPPLIVLNNVEIFAPDRAIEAVLVDTLDIGLDSLDLALNAQEGFIYPIQVTLAWNMISDVETTLDDFWIETRLEPLSQFSSSLIDFFLLPQQILPESTIEADDDGQASWTGVYAVPVEAADTPLPEHTLKVSLLRGDQAFAVFETSRDNPERREPVSNVRGGIGFVGGIAIDTLRITVK
ncbi:MAG: hypothetical protein BMS9Abin05_1975 [Rhodothermia bacterium]|nr:MAG: hypothetical protein BMS9Abin05_1975 [Rhodothermia bacterium]